MFDKAFRLTVKALGGKELTEDEAKYLRERNAKYEIIRYVYMEKMRHEGPTLVDFHFTPGESFMDTPTIDIVNDLIKFNNAIKNGNYKVADFKDLDWGHNPPLSGKEKTTL